VAVWRGAASARLAGAAHVSARGARFIVTAVVAGVV
jgi:hypothetical protein